MSPIRPRESETTRCPPGERDVVQLGLVERAAGNLLPGAGEHLGRGVDADHLVPERRQVRGVPTGASGRVERDADGQAVEDLPHDRLLDLEQLVPRLVVGRRPQRVARVSRSNDS
jgi:hypothetical protein